MSASVVKSTVAVMEEATKAFAACSQIPILKSVRIESAGSVRPAAVALPTPPSSPQEMDTSDHQQPRQHQQFLLRSLWSHTAPAAGTKRSFVRHQMVGYDGENLTENPDLAMSAMPITQSETSISTYSRRLKKEVIIYKKAAAAAAASPGATAATSEFILEVWGAEGVVKTVNLTDLEAHGDVYMDEGGFGGLALDSQGKKVAYVAEEKRPKPQPFTKGLGANFKPVSDDEWSGRGEEYCYVEEWGEQMVGKSQTVIVTLDLETEEVELWTREGYANPDKKDNPRIHKVLPDNYCAGKVTWGPSNILFGAAVSTDKRRLGFVYCDNRPSHIFSLNLETNHYQQVTSSSSKISARNPRFIEASDTLLWLERDLGVDGIYPGAHANCMRLMKQTRDDGICTVVDIVDDYKPQTNDDDLSVDDFDIDFAGIYGFNGMVWPSSGNFAVQNSNNETLVLINTFTRGEHAILIVNLNTKDWRILDWFTLHDICLLEDGKFLLIGEESCFFTAPKVIAKVMEAGENDASPAIIPDAYGCSLGTRRSKESVEGVLGYPLKNYVGTEEAGSKNYTSKEKIHKPKDGSGIKFSSLYACADSGRGQAPLLVWLHGGPQSVFPNQFLPDVLFFIKMGYAVLAVNYRGSLGHGQKSVQSLLGQIGTNDVADCVQAVQECLEDNAQDLNGKLLLFGGSHGGFLVTHLAGQFPDMFAGVVCRNPVTDLTTMYQTSDIPDWITNEATAGCYDAEKAHLEPETMKAMLERSPVFHASKIKTPIYFMIGKDDLRVPPQQGIEMYRKLKAMGKAEVKLNVYEDNHPLAKVPVHANVMINTAVFFHQCLQNTNDQ